MFRSGSSRCRLVRCWQGRVFVGLPRCVRRFWIESTADAPTRILDSIEAARVADVRSQLSRSLKAVVYQKLLPVKGGGGRVHASELMLVNPAISNAIRTNELGSIQGQLNNRDTDSIPFEVSLTSLFLDGRINESAARAAEITNGSFGRQKTADRRLV